MTGQHKNKTVSAIFDFEKNLLSVIRSLFVQLPCTYVEGVTECT